MGEWGEEQGRMNLHAAEHVFVLGVRWSSTLKGEMQRGTDCHEA